MAQMLLFDDLPEHPASKIEFRSIKTPVWTENKARLVAEYLRLFVFITKHGCYIDGFAGPKNINLPDSWAADLVLSSEPKFLREFYLCDMDPTKVEQLRELRDRHNAIMRRSIEIVPGDFNQVLPGILASGAITPRKATFCLIDQFSTECHWSTVQQIAAHKTETAKIEVFYFLASGWLDRAIAGFTRNVDIPELWWGRDDWRALLHMNSTKRALLVCDRFKSELGYTYANAWPIMSRQETGRVMFHMIHATDHSEAPKLMARAYSRATKSGEAADQFELPLSILNAIAGAYKTTG